MLQLSQTELYGHGKFRITVAFKILFRLCQSKITNYVLQSCFVTESHYYGYSMLIFVGLVF